MQQKCLSFSFYETFTYTLIASTHASCDFLAYHNCSRLTLRWLQGFKLNMLSLTSEDSSIPGWTFTEATILGPVLLKPHSVSSASCFPAPGRHFPHTELLFVTSFPKSGPDWQPPENPLAPLTPRFCNNPSTDSP